MTVRISGSKESFFCFKLGNKIFNLFIKIWDHQWSKIIQSPRNFFSPYRLHQSSYICRDFECWLGLLEFVMGHDVISAFKHSQTFLTLSDTLLWFICFKKVAFKLIVFNSLLTIRKTPLGSAIILYTASQSSVLVPVSCLQPRKKYQIVIIFSTLFQ